jgi:hypothetical protein
MLGLGLALAIAATTGASSPPVGRIYSDVCTEGGGGDERGHQVIVEALGPHPRIWLSWSEGGLGAPVLATSVSYDPGRGSLTFDAPASTGTAHFAGRLDGSTLTGTVRDYWADKPSPVRLSRVKSAAVRPPCRYP